MTAAYSHAVDRQLAAFGESPVGFNAPPQQYASSYATNAAFADYPYTAQHYSTFADAYPPQNSMDVGRLSPYGDYLIERPVLNADVGPNGAVRARSPEPGYDMTTSIPSPYDLKPSTPPRFAAAAAAYARESGGVTDMRVPPVDPDGIGPIEMGTSPTRQFDGARPMSAVYPSTPRHPSAALAAGVNGTGPQRTDAQQFSPIIPSSASPSYKPSAIPISPNTRAVAQRPTYITPPSSPTPISANPMYSYNGQQYNPEPMQGAPTTRVPIPSQPFIRGTPNFQDSREICVECAMRDQDMADVDVTSPGVWDQESDVYYHELCRLEEEEELARARASGSSLESHTQQPLLSEPKRPRARGHKLTEPNLKLWLSINPKEPQARQQTIDLYVKTQTALLEAEALARARALQESKVLDSKLKDTYDSLRRSTGDGNAIAVAAEDGGVRIKAATASRRPGSGPSPLVRESASMSRQSQSREVTLLENGMIVEHVDVRKEEKERKREERRERSRARKSSRGSGGNAEVTSMYSTNSPLPNQMDGGFYAACNGSGMISQSRDRPISPSTLQTAPLPRTPPPPGMTGTTPCNGLNSVRIPNGHVQSQISLVDSQSISSASMSPGRRSRFFAFRNWSEAWKSRESFAASGIMSASASMMDMHLALERERRTSQIRPSTMDFSSTSAFLSAGEQLHRRASFSNDRSISFPANDKPKKKKGLAKLWGIVTGNKSAKVCPEHEREAQYVDRPEDEPLAPPPPLSYLVNRTSRERPMSSASRRASMPMTNTQPAPTLPTPTSIRNTWIDTPVTGVAHAEESSANGSANGSTTINALEMSRGLHPALSEPDIRGQTQEQQTQAFSRPTTSATMPAITRTPSSPRPISILSLHKSLPPLPDEARESQPVSTPVDPRPRTMFDMKDAGSPLDDDLDSPRPLVHDDARRQSFGGMGLRPDSRNVSTFPLNNERRNQYESKALPIMELGTMHARASIDPETEGTDKKRRSRFGFSSLFGRKNNAGRTSCPGAGAGAAASESSRLSIAPMMRSRESPPCDMYGASSYTGSLLSSLTPVPVSSDSDSHVDGSPDGIGEHGFGSSNGGPVAIGTGNSNRSWHGPGLAPPSRLSVTSRKAIEELVEQEPDFVAYRYPSVDQNIALLR